MSNEKKDELTDKQVLIQHKEEWHKKLIARVIDAKFNETLLKRGMKNFHPNTGQEIDLVAQVKASREAVRRGRIFREIISKLLEAEKAGMLSQFWADDYLNRGTEMPPVIHKP